MLSKEVPAALHKTVLVPALVYLPSMGARAGTQLLHVVITCPNAAEARSTSRRLRVDTCLSLIAVWFCLSAVSNEPIAFGRTPRENAAGAAMANDPNVRHKKKL